LLLLLLLLLLLFFFLLFVVEDVGRVGVVVSEEELGTLAGAAACGRCGYWELVDYGVILVR